ncbi:HNH endonuclease [Streptomyces sp. NPDC001513]|uniref:HNH endonuclease n=1 Tax=Streptomyces sp. NPDC001513 TaxID=3364580 RepID=UPI00368AC324
MTAWLMYLGESAKRVGQGYDDHPSSHYSWDDKVPNRERIQVGDTIVLWNGKALLGLSVIEDIAVGAGKKTITRCPKCGTAGPGRRKKDPLPFRCWNKPCKHAFADPVIEIVDVKTYRSRHEAGWVDLRGHVSGTELRALCVKTKSQNAVRELRWDEFRSRVETGKNATSLKIVEKARSVITHGFSERMARVRKGQAAFRASLLDHFGEVCAFTGPMPAAVLDAAHLYSYADQAKHHESGGLLLRKDVHRLFDLGEIAIDPKTLTLDVAPNTRAFPAYDTLHGQAVAVSLDKKHQEWIAEHWNMHRAPSQAFIPGQSAGAQVAVDV